MILDNGAYTSWGATTPSVMMMPITTLYRVPNVRYEAKCVYTNNTYAQAMRGYGNPQATFAIESTMDMLAEKAGIDPLEFRRINANQAGDVSTQGLRITTCGLEGCMDTVKEKVGWGQNLSDGEGIGLASLIHVGGGARVYKSDGCGTMIKMDDFGKVDVFTGATDMGQGSDTVSRPDRGRGTRSRIWTTFMSFTATPMSAPGMWGPMPVGPPLSPAMPPWGRPAKSRPAFWK